MTSLNAFKNALQALTTTVVKAEAAQGADQVAEIQNTLRKGMAVQFDAPLAQSVA